MTSSEDTTSEPDPDGETGAEAAGARRKMGRRLLIGGALVLAAVSAVAMAIRLPAVQDALMTRVIEERVSRSVGDVLGDDALHVLVCGSASPLPSPERAQACVAVFAGGRGYVFDIGTGAAENLAAWRAPAETIERVFLTHFHSDHFGDLGDLNLLGWVAGRKGPLVVHGPPGVERVVGGMQEAYAHDRRFRVELHGSELLPPEYGEMTAAPFEVSDEASVVHEHGDLTIRAFPVDHSPVAPAVGYRVDYRGRSVVISGDTTPSPTLVAAAQNADLLLHEALAPHMVRTIEAVMRAAGQERTAKVMSDIPDYHTSAIEAARIANEANVRRLVLYHLDPAPPSWPPVAERVFLRDVSTVREDVSLAADGALYTLPVGSEAIHERAVEP